MNGPRPSTRVFLSDLSSLQADSKIRFLGCKIAPPSVSVDINALLEDLTAEELRVGTWLNVVGYVRESEPVLPPSSFSSTPDDANRPSQRPSTVTPRPVYIEAIMVFLAGAIAIGEYERILCNSQHVERMIQFTH
ncbi:Telomere length regulation/capping, TEN1 [Penicillium expansum]|uniref:Telomere length regulation/capping, TEN1 n=1 Tax=Penicillium expansum TaxID=27334 RepID=A0A0A2JJE0_PENEN|nr:Telomere length regulation/capping, TEN1 [Penicillium expansum]KGO44943.1 Telomere length regulation/capping, TEN1 [Penicillium expansum]KGO54941.1 Telomere length regulation/capping, TEN1 [Penicillium expansum]KGO64817.1 Telomere length regulation/capping, TEN1 [Penicillium expansum]